MLSLASLSTPSNHSLAAWNFCSKPRICESWFPTATCVPLSIVACSEKCSEAVRDMACDFSRIANAQSRRAWNSAFHDCMSVLFARNLGGSSGVKTSGSGVEGMVRWDPFDSSRLYTKIFFSVRSAWSLTCLPAGVSSIWSSGAISVALAIQCLSASTDPNATGSASRRWPV